MQFLAGISLSKWYYMYLQNAEFQSIEFNNSDNLTVENIG